MWWPDRLVKRRLKELVLSISKCCQEILSKYTLDYDRNIHFHDLCSGFSNVFWKSWEFYDGWQGFRRRAYRLTEFSFFFSICPCFISRCAAASLWEVVSVRPSVGTAWRYSDKDTLEWPELGPIYTCTMIPGEHQTPCDKLNLRQIF